jgi:ribonucleotide monophosphatase NagD (HAD superfamily)
VDVTLPTERGLLPGNGAFVVALQAATDREPLVAGKPAVPLLDQAAKSLGAQRPLVVGDRLDTDIAGAINAGMDSLLVLTGVSTEAEALALPPEQRPTYIASDLSGLLQAPKRVNG